MTVISMPSRSDFDAVFDKPDAKSGTRDFLVLAKLTSEISCHRIGFVTSRKKIRRAVDRNHFRRVVREFIRSQYVAPDSDIVVIARKLPDGLRSRHFKDELNQVFTKLTKQLSAINAE